MYKVFWIADVRILIIYAGTYTTQNEILIGIFPNV